MKLNKNEAATELTQAEQEAAEARVGLDEFIQTFLQTYEGVSEKMQREFMNQLLRMQEANRKLMLKFLKNPPKSGQVMASRFAQTATLDAGVCLLIRMISERKVATLTERLNEEDD